LAGWGEEVIGSGGVATG